MQTNKKIYCILLLFLIVTPLIIYSYFGVSKMIVHHEMKLTLEKEKLHSISILQSSLQWEDEGKEVWVNGQLFDVKYLEERGDSLLITGLFDNEETMLDNEANKLLQKKNSNNNALDNLVFKFLFSLAMVPNNSIEVKTYNLNSPLFAFYSDKLLIKSLSVESPPPLM